MVKRCYFYIDGIIHVQGVILETNEVGWLVYGV